MNSSIHDTFARALKVKKLPDFQGSDFFTRLLEYVQQQGYHVEALKSKHGPKKPHIIFYSDPAGETQAAMSDEPYQGKTLFRLVVTKQKAKKGN